MYRYLAALLLSFTLTGLHGQEASTSDSLIAQAMREEGVTFSHDNSVRLFMTGQEKFDNLFEAVRNARHSIHLEYFNFRNDSIADALFDLLAMKTHQGVEVRALFDAFGNFSNNKPLTKSHLKSLRIRGIDIHEYDPLDFPWVNRIYGRDHRKIVVIDGRIAYTGGMNVADYYLKGTQQVGTWRDMHCRIEGHAVNDLQAIFLKIWNKTTGQNVGGEEYFRGGESAGGESAGSKTVGILNREPHVSPAIMRNFYLNAINQAQHHIRIINPYLTLNRKFKKALAGAVERGVKVEIMISAHSDIPVTPDCMYYVAHQLMKKGVSIWLYKPGFHHSKIMMVDDLYCTVGSTNLDSRSLRCDYEANALILDRETTAELTRMFDADKADSFLLTPQTWDAFRNGWQKFRGWLFHFLSPFL